MSNTQPDIPVAYASVLAPAIPVLAHEPSSSSFRHARGGMATPREDASYYFSACSNMSNNADHASPIPAQCLHELKEQGYTRGLAEALWRNKRAMPLAFWVVDNSGSMSTADGHRLVMDERGRGGSYRVVPCTRWTELVQSVEYHVQLSALLRKTTVFRLLNDPGIQSGPQQFGVNERGDALVDEDMAIACSVLQNASPGGVTPLVGHLHEIRQSVAALEPSLRQNGTKVAIVLATDGVPTDDQGCSNDAVKREFVRALRALEGLPVWVVVRLCTDEDEVVRFWNNLDNEVELSLEVLDDYTSEAQEVYKLNPWLNYGLPLHRMREMGFYDKTFDLIDERKLNKDELVRFFRIVFGADAMEGAPDPEVNWDGFVARIASIIQGERAQWNPVTRRLEPWVDVRRLKREYGNRWFW